MLSHPLDKLFSWTLLLVEEPVDDVDLADKVGEAAEDLAEKAEEAVEDLAEKAEEFKDSLTDDE